MKTILSTVAVFVLLSSAIACAPPEPPQELVNARADLVRAKQGPAGQLDPAGIHDADVALSKAERMNSDDHDNPNTIDQAVVASLKAKTAEAKAASIQAENDKVATEQSFHQMQASQLSAAQGQLAATQGDLNKTQEQLAMEKKQRADAEAQLKSARLTLAQIASVKDDARGMVVTFQGEALFKTNKSELLPGAMAKLDEVASTLQKQDRKITVLGFTDSTGTAALNQTLSQARADAVKTYLTSKGVPQDIIKAEGRGPSQPVADNGSIEGRAMNRRVEIILAPPADMQGPTSGMSH